MLSSPQRSCLTWLSFLRYFTREFQSGNWYNTTCILLFICTFQLSYRDMDMTCALCMSKFHLIVLFTLLFIEQSNIYVAFSDRIGNCNNGRHFPLFTILKLLICYNSSVISLFWLIFQPVSPLNLLTSFDTSSHESL